MTPEEKAIIKEVLYRQKAGLLSGALRILAQALIISRQPLQGPELIPCMEQSATGAMFCRLPKGHDTVFLQGIEYHEGIASDGSRRAFIARKVRK